MYFNRKCKITFIAHGATIYTDEMRYSDNETYPPLNETGEEEIEKICDFLRKRAVKNDVIYASPSVRTVQSAKIIAKIYKQDFEIINDLHPRQCGGWNNLTFKQVEKKYSTDLEKVFTEPEKRFFPDSESMNEFIERTGNIIKKVVSDNLGSRIIIVTHPEVIQAAIVSALELPADKISRFFINTGSATQISYYERWASLKYSGYVPL